MVKLHCIGEILRCRRLFRCIQGGTDLKDGLDPVAACHGLGDIDNQVCQLDQFHQDLRHVVVQGYHSSLGNEPCLHPKGTGIHQPDDRKIDENVSHRVHECRDPPHIFLCSGQILVAGVKAADLLLLLAEGTNHPDTG